ncbi:hypothetical protein BC332_14984 [Capsicum chinense]|nr:hypothetical protein BC332_14984 [Capsicum chinense]
MKKLTDKATSKSKKSTSKASKKKFDDSGRHVCRREEIKKYFGENVLRAFRNTIFGIFLNLPRCNWIGQISKCLLMLEIQQDNKDELHVWVQGEILKFTMLEFIIISGLKCTGNIDDYMYTSSSKSALMSRYFSNNKGAITRSKLITRVQNGNFDNAEDALNLAILFFVHTFMFSQHKEGPIVLRTFKLLRTRNAIPRLLNWSVQCIRPKYESFMSGMFIKHSYKNIQPTTDEVRRLDLSFPKDFEICDPTTYASTSDSKKLKRTAVEIQQRVGTIAEEFGDFSTIPPRKILIKADFESPVSPDQPLKKRKTIFVVIQKDKIDEQQQSQEDGSNKQERQHKSDMQHEDYDKGSLNDMKMSCDEESNKQNLLEEQQLLDVNAANKDAGHEDNFENEDCSDLQASEDVNLTAKEDVTEVNLKNQKSTDVTDVQVRELQASKEKAPAKQERKKSRVLRSPYISKYGFGSKDAVDIDKEEKLKKETDNHYRVNASELGFRQLYFVVAYPQSKNWLYLMSERKTCWNDEPSLEAYKRKITQQTGLVNEIPFDVDYMQNIPQQASDSLDCGVFVCAYAEILSGGLQVHSCEFDSACQRACYASLLWNYRVEKANEGYRNDNGDLARPRKSVIEEIEANANVTLE